MTRDAALLVTPSGPVAPALLDAGVAVAGELGLPLAWPAGWRDGLLARDGWLAGSDAERAARLRAAADLGPRGLWMARGGYGAVRTLEQLAGALDDVAAVPLWGFSDGTALLAAWDRAGAPAWLAPPVIQLPRLDAPSLGRLVAAWHREEVPPFEALETLSPGEAEAPLAGGNLCVLASLAGTPFAADLTDRIVVLEDVGEPGYKVDRMWAQLRLSGALAGARALVLGDFTGVAEEERVAIVEHLGSEARRLGLPAAAGLPVGHGCRNAALPYGGGGGWRGRLVARAGGPATLEVVR